MIEEQAKYPKGTRLLSEDVRVETLNSLLESRKEIMTLLEKMPISMKTKIALPFNCLNQEMPLK